jgi:hypothetical protein
MTKLKVAFRNFAKALKNKNPLLLPVAAAVVVLQ